MEEAMFKAERLKDIEKIMQPLNQIFDIATDGQIKVRLNVKNEMIEFINSHQHKICEVSCKNKNAFGSIKAVMEQI